MSKRRDRHGRGMRGPLSQPSDLIRTPVPIREKATRTQVFVAAIQASVTRVAQECPQALVGIDVGYEDVPTVLPTWETHSPLASSTPARPGIRGQVVLYRRPIELRTQTRNDLRRLVHHTLVEQLSAATGIPTDELDLSFDPDDAD